MGCTLLKSKDSASGLLLPDQEIAINTLENSHPFNTKDTTDLFCVFSQFGIDASLSQDQFLSLCNASGLIISQQHCLFIEHISDRPGSINVKKLLLTTILLGKGDFHTKFEKLLDLYDISHEDISLDALIQLFKELIHAGTYILPKMSETEESVDKYLSKIRSAESALVINLISYFIGFRAINKDTMLEVFTHFPELQKICWGNGVRLLLLEQDIRLGVSHDNNNSQTKIAFCNVIRTQSN